MSIKNQSLTPGGVMQTRTPFTRTFSTAVLLIGAASSALLAGSAHAALVEVGNTQWNDNAARTVSVYAGNSYIDAWLGNPGPGTNVNVDLGTVAEYAFFNGDGGVSTPYASLGTRISDVTANRYSNNNTLVAQELYTISDPTGGTPDYNAKLNMNGTSSVAGTVDITGLSSGTLYILIGSNGAEGRDTNLTVTQGASSVVTAQSGGGYYQSGGTGFWANSDTISVALEIDFTNTGDNTVSYDYTSSGAGKFMGVILSDTVAVPEPGSLALLGLGGLMIARRRRG